MSFPDLSCKLLREMKVGETRLMIEPEYTPCPGAAIQSRCVRIGCKVTTEKCFVILPTSNDMTTAIMVTKISNERIKA